MTSTRRRVEKEKPGRRERIIVSYTCATVGSEEDKTFIKPQKLQSNKLINSISNGDDDYDADSLNFIPQV